MGCCSWTVTNSKSKSNVLNNNFQKAKSKQYSNSKVTNSKYDLEERTLSFAGEVRAFFKLLPRSIANLEDGKQVIRSSGSIGANYIEANEALGKKDFILRARIARKEAKETRFWLNLIDTNENSVLEKTRGELITEVTELLKILSSILNKSK